MNNQNNSPIQRRKSETEKQPTVLDKTETDSLLQLEKRYNVLQEYYQCCGGY